MAEQLSGRELDAAIAVRLFSFDWWRSTVTKRRALFAEGKQPEWFKYRATGGETLCVDWDVSVPRFSESLEAAMQVVEKMRALGWQAILVLGRKLGTRAVDNDPIWYAEFSDDSCNEASAESESLPEAICRAALAAIGDQKSK